MSTRTNMGQLKIFILDTYFATTGLLLNCRSRHLNRLIGKWQILLGIIHV